jgi:hypothetical protein
MSKPREFYLQFCDNGDEFIFQLPQTELDVKEKKLVHVIEYSAYEELKAELAIMDKNFIERSEERDRYKAEAKELREELEHAVKYLEVTCADAEDFDPDKQMLESFKAALAGRSIKIADTEET